MFSDIITALCAGIFFTLVFAGAMKKIGPWSSIAAYFLIVFLGTWAGGLWVTRFGPTLKGIFWMPFFSVGLVISLLLSSAARSSLPESGKTLEQPVEKELPAGELDLSFWILFVGLSISILGGYLTQRTVL